MTNEELAIDKAIDTDIDAYIEAQHTRHMFGGLNGVRCGYIPKLHESTKIALTWDSVTCPDCLAKKQDYEPWSADIDTRGD